MMSDMMHISILTLVSRGRYREFSLAILCDVIWETKFDRNHDSHQNVNEIMPADGSALLSARTSVCTAKTKIGRYT